MASVFVHLAIDFRHRHARDDLVFERAGVFYREFVVDSEFIDASESLGQELILGAAEHAEALREVVEVACLYNQRVAVPVAARITGPETNVVVNVCIFVERHNTRVVDHFGHDNHSVFTLYDLHVVVIHARREGRA